MREMRNNKASVDILGRRLNDEPLLDIVHWYLGSEIFISLPSDSASKDLHPASNEALRAMHL